MKKLCFVLLFSLLGLGAFAGVSDKFCPVRASYACGQTRTVVHKPKKIKRVNQNTCIIRASRHCGDGNGGQ